MTEPVNPYAPPQARVEDVPEAQGERVLASRWRRFGAAMLDGAILSLLVWLPLYALCWVSTTLTFLETVRNGLLGISAFVAINGLWLARHGQTVGKRLLGLRIVRSDGARASAGRLLGLRYGIGAVLSAVPVAGPFYGLVDSLLIFRASRQCVHDTIADTIVINA